MVAEYSRTVNVLREVKPERSDFVVLVRFEDLILPGLLASSDGAISGLVHIAPGLFVGLVRAFEKGELDRSGGAAPARSLSGSSARTATPL